MITIDNAYLSDGYAPVHEEVTARDLEVTGGLPPELNGRWLRNGPNPVGDVDPAVHHWFRGDGMVHGVRLREGAAEWYRNRWVRSDTVTQALREDPVGATPTAVRGFGPNTSVGGFAGTTWALVEAGATPMRLTYDLDTIGYDDFDGSLPGPFTAHPKYDPATGELHAVCYHYPDIADRVHYVVVGSAGKVTKLVEIPIDDMPMIHDMSLTEKFALVYDQPVTVDFDRFAAGKFPFAWNPDHGSRVGLMPRDGEAADIVWCDAPIGYAFHPVNAYDTADGGVVVDLCVYDRMFDEDFRGPFGDSLATLHRWTIDPIAGSVADETISGTHQDFPRHDPRVGCQKYRYAYTASLTADHGGIHGPTYKVDVDSGLVESHDHGPGRGGSEPIFIPREGSSGEDDGWLVVLVHDATRNHDDLVVLDATEFRSSPVATIHLPRRVPYGFHGNWVSDSVVPPA